jgi:hypothetical protein
MSLRTLLVVQYISYNFHKDNKNQKYHYICNHTLSNDLYSPQTNQIYTIQTIFNQIIWCAVRLLELNQLK